MADMKKVFEVKARGAVVALLVALLGVGVVNDAMAQTVELAVNRSQLLSFSKDMAEVIVANPEIADVHNHGTRKLSVIGKSKGQTTVRVFDKSGELLGQYAVTVGVDLPDIRRALKQFLPGETIGVEMVNTNVALTGKVSSAEVVGKAIKITREFLKDHDTANKGAEREKAESKDLNADYGIINLLQVTSGQQVMLRVRVGEVNRTALKELGIEWANFGAPGDFFYNIAKDTGQQAFVAGSAASFITDPTEALSFVNFGWQNGSAGINGLLKALERDSLFKLLAEPNLVAVSGEEAEFLAGGEIPVPIPQGGTGGGSSLTIEYKPFGVAVKFRPFVLSENRLRVEVQPEVSELNSSIAVNISGFTVPGITTRRAKTTVELAPGESFMIAGLIKDEARTTIDNVPGAKELPVLGALFRSTQFQRDETELVIAVTPYLVDPVRSSDIKMPTDGFAHASDMEMIFYGALGTLSNGALYRSNTPVLEGPVGFMVD